MLGEAPTGQSWGCLGVTAPRGRLRNVAVAVEFGRLRGPGEAPPGGAAESFRFWWFFFLSCFCWKIKIQSLVGGFGLFFFNHRFQIYLWKGGNLPGGSLGTSCDPSSKPGEPLPAVTRTGPSPPTPSPLRGFPGPRGDPRRSKVSATPGIRTPAPRSPAGRREDGAALNCQRRRKIPIPTEIQRPPGRPALMLSGGTSCSRGALSRRHSGSRARPWVLRKDPPEHSRTWGPPGRGAATSRSVCP